MLVYRELISLSIPAFWIIMTEAYCNEPKNRAAVMLPVVAQDL